MMGELYMWLSQLGSSLTTLHRLLPTSQTSELINLGGALQEESVLFSVGFTPREIVPVPHTHKLNKIPDMSCGRYVAEYQP